LMQDQTAKILITAGIIAVIAGIIMLFFKDIPLGRLPGDIHIQKGNTSFYFPLTTSIIISVILSIIFFILGRK